jgi:hypothetical protein
MAVLRKELQGIAGVRASIQDPSRMQIRTGSGALVPRQATPRSEPGREGPGREPASSRDPA